MKTKRFIAVAILLLLANSTYAQTVNNVPLKDIDIEYIDIVGTSSYSSPKVSIAIYFGQSNKYFSTNDIVLKDEDGKVLVFNSMVDALNFVSRSGYEFVKAYAISISDQNFYHYQMREKRT